MSSTLSGLAGTIRAAVDSETFDLAGKSAATIERAVKEAFANDFPLQGTIRLTFVVGAGKLARQKYDEHAFKAVTGPLKDLGYEDDAGGGAGTFKLQHDTGKNLKTVVVYPKVSAAPSVGMGELTLETASLIPEGTPEHKVALSTINVFEQMMASMCPSWSQKKACLKAIEDLNATIQRLDKKLMTGTPLSDSEQEFYDSVSAKSLADKGAMVKEMMHSQVEAGSLTSPEKSFLLGQVTDRISAVEKDVAEAEKGNKTKRVEVLQKNLAKAIERKEMLNGVVPKRPHPLKNQGQIAKLRKDMVPLLKIESSAKGRLLSLKESQDIAKKEQIEAEITELEMSSRGWFETDEDFEARLEASRTATKPAAAPKKAAKPAVSSGKTTSWVTPGSSAWGTKKGTGSRPSTAKSKASKSGGGGGVFAAMMMDSDSD